MYAVSDAHDGLGFRVFHDIGVLLYEGIGHASVSEVCLVGWVRRTRIFCVFRDVANAMKELDGTVIFFDW